MKVIKLFKQGLDSKQWKQLTWVLFISLGMVQQTYGQITPEGLQFDSPLDQELHKRIGQADQAFHEKRFSEALTLYKNTLEDRPEDPYVWLRVGTIFYLKDDYSMAEEALQRSIQFAAREVSNQLSEIELSENKLENDPNNETLKLGLEEDNKKLKTILAHKASAEHFLGRSYLKQGKLKAAKRKLESVANQNDQQPLKLRQWQIHWDLARTHIALAKENLGKEWTQADQFNVTEFETALGMSQIAREEFENAIELVFKLEEENFLTRDKKVSLGNLFVAFAGFLHSQGDLAKRFHEQHPNISRIWVNGSEIDLDQLVVQNIQTAATLLDQAEKLDPQEPSIYFARIENLLRSGISPATKRQITQTLEKAEERLNQFPKGLKRHKYQGYFHFTSALIALSENNTETFNSHFESLKALADGLKNPNFSIEIGKEQDADWLETQQIKTQSLLERLLTKLTNQKEKR